MSWFRKIPSRYGPKPKEAPVASVPDSPSPVAQPAPSWAPPPAPKPVAEEPAVPTRSAADERWIEEALRVCTAAARGDMEARILRIDADPRMAELLYAINHMLDMTDAFVREATASLEHASHGKFFRRVLPEGMLGSFRRASESINGATAQMDVKTRDLKAAEERRLALDTDVAEARRVAEDLTKATAKIADVSKVIGRIADQTDLLALNATIEAARVGPAGRGFAVVATEVKRLATQAGAATQQIQEHLTAVRSASERTMQAVNTIWDVIRVQSAKDDQPLGKIGPASTTGSQAKAA